MSWLWNATEPARPKNFGSAVALLALALLPALAHAANFTATLDRDTVAVGEAATLTLTCDGGSPKAAPAVPRVAGLRIIATGDSQQFSFGTGGNTSSHIYTYSLAPTQAGEFTIAPIEVVIGNETFRSPAMKLKAAPVATSPDLANADGQLVLLKLASTKKQIYVGESVPVELQVYVSEKAGLIQGQSQLSPFAGEGFTFSKTAQAQGKPAHVGNANFTMFPVFVAATPVKSGNLKVEPVDFTALLEIAGTAPRQRDAFDPFGFFQRNETRRVTLSSTAETIEVLPLPEGAPADFNGAVGSYSLTMTASPTNVAAGDPVTVKIQIGGRGTIENLTLPAQTGWNDFKVYPPTSKVQLTDQLGLQGSKDFELVVVPASTDVKELPALTFSFFDPEAKAYRTISPAPIKLAVRPGSNISNNTLAAAQPRADATPQDIVPVKQHLGPLTRNGRALVSSPAFWFAQSLPALAWMTLLVRRKRADALANNPRLRRQRAVTAMVAAEMNALQQYAMDKDSDEFFATLFRLLQEQLGERLDAPASSITEAVIDERLRPLGMTEPALNRLQELFQACNLARYAPVKSTHELAAFIPRLETTLREIREVNA